jgi:hypothetical protein
LDVRPPSHLGPATRDITKALFQSRTRTALLRTVLRDGVSDSMSGLARRTGLSPHAVAVEVRNLAAAGLVEVESIGGADVVRVNSGHPAIAPLVQLLEVAEAKPPNRVNPDVPVRESLAYFGATLGGCKRRRHFSLETTLARGLSIARRDATILQWLPVVLLKNRRVLDWPVLKEEARRLKLKGELEMVVEMAADASGHAELKAHVADLKDRRRKLPAFVIDASARDALRKKLPGSTGWSLAAATAAASERERIEKMGAANRALLSLDLGERLGAIRRTHA